ncbi:hypothetical protein ACQKJ1_23795 [Methylorubrum rhodesianum]|jgi:hypothetical protein|uniref:hypothetical protein n=1 Tax=Methylobacteriaceae TaxID=119045 RepID=UPI001F13417E|nr:hypothetical protein [Methylobacterium organophilum]UMY20295.1 hypothetical protein MMB17_24975 [Methylobacterium organophilum]HSI10932.1 hypothetical protein [Chthoniobacter sp.]
MEVLSDRQRIELALPAYLLLALSSAPRVFSPSNPSDAERAKADISNLRTQLGKVSLESFADLSPKKYNSLKRRLERTAKAEIANWKDQSALLMMIMLCLFLNLLVDRQHLILWEGTPMDWAMRQLFQMSKHGFDDAELVATAHIHAAQMLDRLQKEGLYLSDFASDARGLQD